MVSYPNHSVSGQALSSLPVLSAHSFASNWQLLFWNQQKRENGRWKCFHDQVSMKACTGRGDRAGTWQNPHKDCDPSKGSDQLAHPYSLIRDSAVCLKKVCDLSCPKSTKWRLIKLGKCPGWSESSLGAQVILFLLQFSDLKIPAVNSVPANSAVDRNSSRLFCSVTDCRLSRPQS